MSTYESYSENIKNTSKNFDFEILSETSVKDLNTGLIWSIPSNSRHDQFEALLTFGSTLPTKEEFEIAETHGIREVLNIRSHWFWSSSLDPSNTHYAYYFSGAGYMVLGNRKNYDGAIVCISNRPVIS